MNARRSIRTAACLYAAAPLPTGAFRINDGPAGGGPLTESAGIRDPIALAREQSRGQPRAAARGAVKEHVTLARRFEEIFPEFPPAGEIAERQQCRRGSHAGPPLAGLAHVDEDGIAGTDGIRRISRSNTRNGFEERFQGLQELHLKNQETAHFSGEAGAGALGGGPACKDS